jgi:CheY-like chemotaxis protein
MENIRSTVSNMVMALRDGSITFEDACRHYHVFEDELGIWERAHKPRAVADHPEKSKRVLIVEPNEFNVQSFQKLLQDHGYETLVAKQALEAVSLANVHLPDLILMSDQFPDVSGLDATSLLKAHERTRRIPVVAVFSFFGEQEAIDWAAMPTSLSR